MHLATDVGGTFTDFVVLREGRLETFKLASTPEAPQRALDRGLARALQGPGTERLHVFSHASTVATNSVLERKGAKVSFITTRGFADLLHIGRQDRPQLYNFDARRPEPLVERELCLEVDERLGPDGEVIKAMDQDMAQQVVQEAKEAGAQALAVCLLHCYAVPAHERILGEAAVKAGLPCSLSSQVWPEYREYERASTTVLDAYLRPVITEYLHDLQGILDQRAPGASLRLMVSSGAMRPARSQGPGGLPDPVEMLLSGPAGGVAAAAHVAGLCGEPDVVTLDMGGTSTDVALLLKGRPALSTRGEVAGLPVRLPRVAIETVGAGGGSIARLDHGGTLRVGPDSAGARPGPASYGQGGLDLTITDALLLTGWLPPLELSDKIILEPELARQVAGPLAEAAGLELETMAMGVLEVAMATMLRPLEALTVRQGHHPGRLALMAFGGAGPLLACGLARRLGSSRVVLPARAGVFSALGLALSPVRFHRSRALMVEATQGQERLVQAMEFLVGTLQEEALGFDLDPRDGAWDWSVDGRYQGQAHELTVPAPDPNSPAAIAREFHALHERTNGYAFPQRPVEFVALRGSLTFPSSPVELPQAPAEGSRHAKAPWEAGTTRVLWNCEWHEAQNLDRESLPCGFRLEGPSIVLERGSTAFVPPHWKGKVDRWSNLLLEVADGG